MWFGGVSHAGGCFLFLYVVEDDITVLALMLINVVYGG
jgi:hypothetical protein